MLATHTITSEYRPKQDKEYPELRLRGKWLAACGFNIKDRVIVTYTQQGQIVITKEEAITCSQ